MTPATRSAVAAVAWVLRSRVSSRWRGHECHDCEGHGSAPMSVEDDCATWWLGGDVIEDDCATCHGTGRLVQSCSATRAALEVARNVASALTEWIDDPVEVVRHALLHRRRYFGLRVADIDEAARAAGAAWVAGYGRAGR